MFYPKDTPSYLKELVKSDLFKAEVHLEEELVNGFLREMTTLPVSDNSFALQYARLQGKVEALRDLASKRKLLITQPENPVSASVNKRN